MLTASKKWFKDVLGLFAIIGFALAIAAAIAYGPAAKQALLTLLKSPPPPTIAAGTRLVCNPYASSDYVIYAKADRVCHLGNTLRGDPMWEFVPLHYEIKLNGEYAGSSDDWQTPSFILKIKGRNGKIQTYTVEDYDLTDYGTYGGYDWRVVPDTRVPVEIVNSAGKVCRTLLNLTWHLKEERPKPPAGIFGY